MARIRTIKPAYWTSEQVMNCSRDARLLFIGLLNFSDDNGVQPYSPMRIKAQIFPADELTLQEMEVLLSELMTQELIIVYQFDAKKYIYIINFRTHQRIDKPGTSALPKPEILIEHGETVPGCLQIRRTFDEHSQNVIGTFDYGKGKGKGRGKEVLDLLSPTTEVIDTFPKVQYCEVQESTTSRRDNELIEIFDFWKKELEHPRAKLDAKRRKSIKNALSIGYTVDDCKQAILGCRATPWNMGQNPGGKKFDQINLILRDASQIDRFIKNYEMSDISPTQLIMQEAKKQLINETQGFGNVGNKVRSTIENTGRSFHVLRHESNERKGNGLDEDFFSL